MPDYDIIGQTVMEYRDNTQRIACLKKRLMDQGKQFVTLGQHLEEKPDSVTIDGRGIHVTDPHPIVITDHTTTMPASVLDLTALQNVLKELAEAERERQQLERTLNGMGLANLLREI